MLYIFCVLDNIHVTHDVALPSFLSICLIQEKFGHVKVPAKGGEYDKLASWMKTQITQYRNSKEGKMPALSQERIKLLEEIGMNWGEKRKTTPWDARYEALIEYRKRFGHVNVPWQWKEDVALAQWVNSQRKKYKDLMDGKRNNLSDEQINRLNLLGAFAFHKSFVVSISFVSLFSHHTYSHSVWSRLQMEQWRERPLHS